VPTSPDRMKHKAWLPATALCLAGALSIGGCSSATRQKIKDNVKQAAGLDTLEHSQQPDGSTMYVFSSGKWSANIFAGKTEGVRVEAVYGEILPQKAVGVFACNAGVLTGEVSSHLSATDTKVLHSIAVHMEPHHVQQPDSAICHDTAFELQDVHDARDLIKDAFGKHAFLYSDANG